MEYQISKEDFKYAVVQRTIRLVEIKRQKRLTKIHEFLGEMYVPNDKSINRVVKNKKTDKFLEDIKEIEKSIKEIYKTITENPESTESFNLKEEAENYLKKLEDDYEKLKQYEIFLTQKEIIEKIKEIYEMAYYYVLNRYANKMDGDKFVLFFLGKYPLEPIESEHKQTTKITNNITEINEENYEIIKENMLKDILRWQELIDDTATMDTLYYNLSSYLDLGLNKNYNFGNIEEATNHYSSLLSKIDFVLNMIEMNAHNLVIDYINRDFFTNRKKTKLQRKIIKENEEIKNLYDKYSIIIKSRKDGLATVTEAEIGFFVATIMDQLLEYQGDLETKSENQELRKEQYQKLRAFWHNWNI